MRAVPGEQAADQKAAAARAARIDRLVGDFQGPGQRGRHGLCRRREPA